MRTPHCKMAVALVLAAQLGNAIYDAVMKNSDLPIRAELSRTENGKVVWEDPDRVPKNTAR